MSSAHCLPLLLYLCAAGIAQAAQVVVTGPAEVVWSHERQACSRTDFADVPVRPFLNDRNQVIWFAGNSGPYFLTKGMTVGADRLARMERASCSGRSLSVPYDGAAGTRPASYHGGVWLEAPFTADGKFVYALAHNEFHGERTGDHRYCDEQFPHDHMVLRCGYWNLIAAHSDDGGNSFTLKGLGSEGFVEPAIALPDPYVFEAADGTPVASTPQGMAAQSNIVRWGDHYYVLVLQLVHSPGLRAQANGVCIFRTAELQGSNPWRGWSASTRAYDVEVPRTYPLKTGSSAQRCTPVLPAHFRFTWSYNLVLRQFILVGVDAAHRGSGSAAFVYLTATLDPVTGELRPGNAQTVLMPIIWLPQWQREMNVEGAAYPSLLDPQSPELSLRGDPQLIPGDRNFQYSGANPYLYYTRLNPRGANSDSTNRDVVRVPLRVTER